MQALWLEDRQLSMREVAIPDAAGHGEALIRVRLSGICGTDLELVRGYYPYTGVLGHEFVGESWSRRTRLGSARGSSAR